MITQHGSRLHGIRTLFAFSVLALACAAGPPAAAEHHRTRMHSSNRSRHVAPLPVHDASRVIQTADHTILVLEPPAGTTRLVFTFVNDTGLVVINYLQETDDPSSFGNAAVLENGKWKELKVPDSLWTSPSKHNSSGHIPLVWGDADGNIHNTIYHRGRYTPVPDKPGAQFFAQAINDRGVMSGMLLDTDRGFGHGLLFDASLSLFEVFDYPDSDDTFIGPGFNNKGLLAGQYYTASDNAWHCFTFDGETFALFPDNPDGDLGLGEPNAVSNKGEIGGVYTKTSDGLPHGYLLYKGRYTDFMVPGANWTTVDAITDGGPFSGEFQDVDGEWHAYVATPRHGRN